MEEGYPINPATCVGRRRLGGQMKALHEMEEG